jgi:hypothetical protein
MPQKESKNQNKFTGFLAYYDDGKIVQEREDYFSKPLNKQCATNWAEINKDKLSALELIWQDQPKIKIDIKDYPHIKPADWFFTQSAYFEMKSRKLTIVARNIGFKKDNIIQVYSIEEATGTLSSSVRSA